MQNVDLKSVLACAKPAGCAQPYLEGFAAELISVGYAMLSIHDYMRSASHLGRWMDSRNMRINQLDNEKISKFARHKCKCPFVWRHGRPPSKRYMQRVRRFAKYLEQLGVVPALATPVPSVVPTPLVGFRTWMIQHRGINPKTVKFYEGIISKILPSLGYNPDVYNATLLRNVFVHEINQLSRRYAKAYVTAIRAFLRFLAIHGRCQPHLDRALPSISEWKLSSLPRYLERNDIERVIDSCDLSTPLGVRDRAILLLLARLALRAGDITAMRLSDIDWEAGTIRVLGKGRKEVCLPLVQDAGEALIEYLQNVRPVADIDQVFLCTNAPIRPFANSSSVSNIVQFALKRAGIVDSPSKGAHLLRHSAATAMLRSGVSLDMIAAILRHKSSDTTAYYAKVDIELLGQIAQPWPEGSSC